MTRAQAYAIAEEAKAQGWAEEINSENYDPDGGEINVIGGPYSDGTPGEWWIVELRMAGAYHNEKYAIHEWDQWRRLKAKTDEIKQILAECVERGWRVDSFGPRVVKKAGRFGMYVEVVAPGYKSYAAARVGGMRTWRKLCREADSIIEPQAALS